MTQQRDTVTVDDLREWQASIITETEPIEVGIGPAPVLVSAVRRRIYPDCPGCGAGVHEGDPYAYMIDTQAETATFRPCGCTLSVINLPEYEQ